MKIVVLAKQVPDTRNVGPDAMTPEGTVNRAALPAVFNPEDLNALEQALRLKDQFPGSTISVVTMGLPKSAEVIREALYRGADQGYVVTDRCLGGADTLATSYTLSQAIRKIGDFDIILGGRQAIDGDTAQVGPQIAEQLHVPQVSYVEELKADGEYMIVKRQFEDQAHMLKVKMPCLLTALAELNEPRYMTVKGIVEAYEKPVTVWGFDDLKNDLNPEWIGLKGSPTNVFQSFGKQLRAPGTKLVGVTPEQAVEAIMAKLIERHII